VPKAAIAELTRAVRASRPPRGSVTAAMRLPDAERDAAIDRLTREEAALFDTWSVSGLSAARKAQRRLEKATSSLLARYPLDSTVAALWAYHAKNGVLLDHDSEIAAGIRVTDPRLDEARWRFLHALWLDPFNPDALNGLGTIAWFDHDLDTAEFFVRAALRQEPQYADAQHDLEMILQLRRHARSGHKQAWIDAPA
jgi:tetratricopeptide (TPR) repeat protein